MGGLLPPQLARRSLKGEDGPPCRGKQGLSGYMAILKEDDRITTERLRKPELAPRSENH